jgi:UPF0716 protein FxsA
MRLLLIVLFIVVPIAELALLIQVGSWIGFWPTLALLVLDAVLGSMLMRSQGRLAWRRFNEAIAEGRAPAREALDGVLVIFGGALLLTPGFITDIFGLLFLIPPTRVLVRRLIVRRATLRMMRVEAPPPSRDGRPRDVDGTAVDVEPDQLDRPQ